ncbi:unnamed protein product [Mytilus edulis]|uniref:Uncharacterized protein n=1 Tax=Mytilus edulis TaxID=6550 RepID=A0A8S3RTH0_MYTED|nr:unnamed protein product [Mytilus edulis]
MQRSLCQIYTSALTPHQDITVEEVQNRAKCSPSLPQTTGILILKECEVPNNIALNCGLPSNVSYLSHGQNCLSQLNMNHTVEYKCDDGQWIEEIRAFNNTEQHIYKSSLVLQKYSVHPAPVPPPNEPPTLDCQSFAMRNQYTAPSKATSLRVTFGPFVGIDKEDGKIPAVSSPNSPAILHRGSNLIMFTVTDRNGYQQSCARNIEVKVVTCNQPPWPAHGFVQCQYGEVSLGSTCTVTCKDGYELTGSSVLKCVAENTFHASPPTCSYKESPYFTNCPTTKHVYADKRMDMATVSWVIPIASDNSGQQPLIIQTKGKPPGSLFGEFTEISYMAKDGSGNESPACTFYIFVEKQFCSPPIFNGDRYLYFTCGKLGYQYGSECTIGCKGSYPLVGNNKMLCERNATSDELYWDWGNQEKPYCKQNKCPVLKAPTNGALACDKWMYGTQCTMQCNNKFDIPIGVGGSSTFTGLFTCSTVSGQWSPLQQVPNCTAACASGSYLVQNTGKCINCPKGSWKDDEDAVNCTRCPIGMSTENNGSTSSDQCKDYDLRLQRASAIVNLRPTNASLKTLSISLWLRRERTNSMIEIEIGGNNGLILNISSEIQLSYSSKTIPTGISVNLSNWNHIGLVIDAASKINTYFGGENRFSRAIAVKPITTHIASIKDHSGLDISGLVVSEKPFTANEIQQLSATCDNGISDALLTSNDLRQITANSIQMIIPSVCDAKDECTTNPCNGHICENGLLGFKCKCNGGYTGSSCEIPPDFVKTIVAKMEQVSWQLELHYQNKQHWCVIVFQVDGHWSHWSEWLPCDASCGGGNEIRYRNCTNPAPAVNGYPCSGSSIETKHATHFTCPACPRRPSAYGVRMQCTTIEDVTNCTATCRDGLAFVPGYPALKEYVCGHKTNYTWNGHPPSCSKLYSPSKLQINSAVSYTNFPCNDVHHAKSQIYKNAKSDFNVEETILCEINIDIKVSPALVNVIKAINELENSALEINTTGQVFQIPGIKIDLADVQVTSDVICSPGKIPITAFCSE